MNWLAHFVLSPDDDRVRLGNWLPDVLSRPQLAALTDPRIRERITLHRRIDETTDRHPAVLAARELLPTGVRRFSAIVLDVIWDHFLSADFSRLAGESLDRFVDRTESGLRARSVGLPDPVRDVIARMERERWLRCYGTTDGVELTFARIASRLSGRARDRFRPAEARWALERSHSAFHAHFQHLWPDLVRLTRN